MNTAINLLKNKITGRKTYRSKSVKIWLSKIAQKKSNKNQISNMAHNIHLQIIWWLYFHIMIFILDLFQNTTFLSNVFIACSWQITIKLISPEIHLSFLKANDYNREMRMVLKHFYQGHNTFRQILVEIQENVSTIAAAQLIIWPSCFKCQHSP